MTDTACVTPRIFCYMNGKNEQTHKKLRKKKILLDLFGAWLLQHCWALRRECSIEVRLLYPQTTKLPSFDTECHKGTCFPPLGLRGGKGTCMLFTNTYKLHYLQDLNFILHAAYR